MTSSTMSSPANSAPGTPSRSGSASPVLTPRSKVKALLAAMESGSDDDGNEDIGALMKNAVQPLAGTKKEKLLFNAEFPDGNLEKEGSDDDEDDDEGDPVIARPKGKLASRMVSAHDAKVTPKDDNAYERVRKSIFGSEGEEKKCEQKEKLDNSATQIERQNTDDEMEEGDDDDDDDIPLPTSRRKKTPVKPKALKANSASPTSTTSTPKSKPQHNTIVTPTSPAADADSDSDALPSNLLGNGRFLALVAKKRKEREEKEAAEKLKEAERRKNRKKLDEQLGTRGPGDSEDDSGEDNVLSQRAPTRRRAGKKALEEMHRETQRMARSMQLSHQARTRKKITKQGLFEKFNFRPTVEEEEAVADSSLALASFESDQPPTSIPNLSPVELTKHTEYAVMDVDTKFDLPSAEQTLNGGPPAPEEMDVDDDITPKSGKGKGKAMARVVNSPTAPRLDKGKGKAIDKGKGKAIETKSPNSKKTRFTLPPVRVILPPQRLTNPADSDSDLEIVAPGAEPKTPPKLTQAVQSERGKMIRSLLAVRRISPLKIRKAGQLTAKELQAQLLQKGRVQAVQEREEQIQELRAKGIIVLSAEERAKEKKEVEDLLEKARQESLAIKRHEKMMEAKKDGGVKKEAGCEDDEDDEGDEDWLEEDEEGVGSIIDELSGSEEEEGEEGEEREEEEGAAEVEEGEEVKAVVGEFSDEEKEGNEDDDTGINTPVFSLSSMYFREQASPSATPRLSEIPAAYIDDEADDDSDGGEFAPFKKKSQSKKQQRKKLRVVEDDDDEDRMEVEQENEREREKEKEREREREEKEKEKEKSKIPSIFRRTEAAPAFMGLGMTQLFAGTIGASGDMQLQNSQERIEVLRRGPGETLPNSQMLDFDGSSQDISQPEGSRLRLDYSQSQEWLQQAPESLPKMMLNYDQELGDDMPDPTQDQGFEHGSSQTAPPRFTQTQELNSSISTQMLDSQFGINRKRRGKLTRRETEFSDEEKGDEESEEEQVEGSEPEQDVEAIAENVFDLMKKVSKKKREPVDMEKLKADTKGLVEDQAEESEDEYAGLGGLSDDEADAGRESEMEDMVDDTNNETVDENALAAFYAEREKARDEKDVTKLLKDLKSGLLRKKRGAEFDLDDSDDSDDGEARRRAKRRQMAKMRKELLKDENIEKIASNPKRLAFLSAIEDRDRDEEMDFLDRGEEDLFVELGMVSQSQCINQSQEVSQNQDSEENRSGGASPVSTPREGPELKSKEGSREITPLPIPPSRRPVKSKISSLAHVREQLSFLVEEKESQLDISDDEDEDGEATVVQVHKRTISVIDRVAVARSASAISENTRMAFQTSGSSAGFKLPPLLRRATSSTISTDNESRNSSTSQGTERSLGQAENSAGVKRGGKASSSINFHAREQTRSKVQNDRETKKKLERKKEGQKRQSVLGMLAKGSFS